MSIREKIPLSLTPRKDYSILEIVSIAIICCALIGTFLNWYKKYQRKIKTSEIPVIMNMIFDAELRYYKASPASAKTLTPTSSLAMNSNVKKFLSLSPQPPAPSPEAQIGNFAQGDWAPLGISYDKPIYYSYSVETKGTGTEASFSIVAQGDLDGDQRYSRYEMVGRFNPNEQALGRGQIYALDPTE